MIPCGTISTKHKNELYTGLSHMMHMILEYDFKQNYYLHSSCIECAMQSYSGPQILQSRMTLQIIINIYTYIYIFMVKEKEFGTTKKKCKQRNDANVEKVISNTKYTVVIVDYVFR